MTDPDATRTAQLRTCERKTARGNVYGRFRIAERVAACIRRHDTDTTARPYRCPCCRRWHVGKPNPQEQ